ncbi:acyltransferase family protein [Altererythrobacter xixiisoli]|uniref:Acyltransferase family protein n=1 Tax=Croceibacterium xixiisoli TaxID=1476466 RepID=A0A6I4TXA5_9SPHN|nr:acyltransferase [Croceibacterium xixiisoli]MXP00635.1 acyltransferase family protein [Croceibacterium xixiisoli]
MDKAEGIFAAKADGLAAPARLGWIDAAKGFSILLVVLLHVSGWFNTDIHPESFVFWHEFSAIFTPLRMPLFFFVSGFLAFSALRKPLTASYPKIFGLYFIYLFWTAAYLLRTLHPALRGGHPAPDPLGYLASLFLPTAFWYIWALPLLYLLAWLLHRAFGKNAVWVLVPAFALAWAYEPILAATQGLLSPPLAMVMLESVASNAIWFFLGMYLRDPWKRVIGSANLTKALSGGLAYLIIAVAMVNYGVDAKISKLVIAPLALWVSAQFLGALNFDTLPGRVVSAVGRFTLPVYIFHLFGIAILSGLVKATGINTYLNAAGAGSSTILIPIITLLLVALSYAAGMIIRSSPFRALIVPPSFQRQQVRQESLA